MADLPGSRKGIASVCRKLEATAGDSSRLTGWPTHLKCRANSRGLRRCRRDTNAKMLSAGNGCSKCAPQSSCWDGGVLPHDLEQCSDLIKC